MHTKERFHLTVRLVCFGILIAAVAFRLASDLPRYKPMIAEKTEEIVQAVADFPTLLYQPPKKSPQIAFSAQDAQLVPVLNWSGADIDAETLIQAPLNFTLSDEPMILIVHTHATEAYCNIDGYRTSDTAQNVVRVGQSIAEHLNKSGIRTLHDTTLIDQSGYYDSYARAAEIIEAYLAQYPTIEMVIDVHRDGVTDANGAQLPLTAQFGGEKVAQLMLVMGSDTAGLSHPNWRENLSFALKLQALCEQNARGIFRNLNLRSQRYNQHLTPHSILIEVGSAGNTLAEALRSAQIFADSLAQLLLSA